MRKALHMSSPKIVNTIGWHTPWLRCVLQFCCSVLDYPYSRLVQAHFSLCHNASYRGWAYCEIRRVRVKINPLNRYPLVEKIPASLPTLEHVDPIDLLISLTAHELAHLERWDRFARQWAEQGRRDTHL